MKCFLLNVLAVGDQKLHCAQCQYLTGGDDETLEILHLILLKDVQYITVSQRTVLTCLKMLDIESRGEEEHGELGGAVTDQGQGGELQHQFHVLLFPPPKIKVVLIFVSDNTVNKVTKIEAKCLEVVAVS